MYEKHLRDAEKLFKYYERNLGEGDGAWKYGYGVAVEWLRLVKLEAPEISDVEKLKKMLQNSPEAQGCAFDELKIMINRWISELFA